VARTRSGWIVYSNKRWNTPEHVGVAERRAVAGAPFSFNPLFTACLKVYEEAENEGDGEEEEEEEEEQEEILRCLIWMVFVNSTTCEMREKKKLTWESHEAWHSHHPRCCDRRGRTYRVACMGTSRPRALRCTTASCTCSCRILHIASTRQHARSIMMMSHV